MHTVLAEKVNAKLFAGLREAQKAIKGESVGKDTATSVIMGHLEELKRQLFGRRWKDPINSRTIVSVDASMLVMQRPVEDLSAKADFGKHSLDERLELDIAMIKAVWNGASKLDLVGLKAKKTRSARHEKREPGKLRTCISQASLAS